MQTVLKSLIAAQAILLLLFSAVHFGLPIPLLNEPRAPLAALLELGCALFLLYASLHEGARMAFWAQAAALGVVLAALLVLAFGQAARTPITEFGIVILLALIGPGAIIADRQSAEEA